MIKLIFESVSPESVFDFSRDDYPSEYLPTTKVGSVSGQEYKKFDKGKDSEIVYMTADEYIERCSDIFGVTVKDVINSARNPKNIDIYADKMLSGEKFPLCYIDYVSSQQEGRHRALAFKKAFGKDAKMPVLVITEANPTLDEIYEYCVKRYGERYADTYFSGYASNFGFSDNQINKYLGIDESQDDDYEVDDLDNLSWDDLDIDIDDLDL